MELNRDTVVWITGASSGIGEALAKALAQKGVHLILTARRQSELERVAQSCQAAASCLVFPMDLMDLDRFPDRVDTILEEYGKIDILINNAGISQRSLGKETLPEVDKRIIELDLISPIYLSKAVLPSMLSRRSGMLVTVSSMAGKFGVPMRSGYSAAKHGLHGFFDALRVECWDDGLKVLMVCPGFIQTQISMNALTEDGSAQKTMDKATANGLTADEAARQIIRGIEREKREIYVAGFMEKYALFMSHFFPGLFFRFIRKAQVT